ncbi:MAG: fibronectin type III domain-containing protein [Acidobacteria bacterium]|nr:fibronectin type III domain-containing protein [Acidobacteriota bacterium]
MEYFRLQLSLFIITITLTATGLAQDTPNLFLQAATPTTHGKNGTAASRFNADLELVDRGATEFQLQLPDGPSVVLRKSGHERRSAGNAVWRGVTKDGRNLEAVLTVKNGLLAGALRNSQELYEIRPGAEGGQIIEKLDPASFQPCGGGAGPARSEAPNHELELQLRSEALQATTPVEIQLLSVYTAAAKNAAGGTAQIEATIQAAVDNANAVFINSQVNARYTLAGTAEVDYVESGTISTDLSWVQSNAGVAALRNQYGADMVSLIINNGGAYCGMGFAMRTSGPSFEYKAFQVTVRSCAVGNLTFAHEHGHNLGMEHDPANGAYPQDASYPWSFGHFENGSYRTVMSYNNQCTAGCPPIPYFSNPNLSYQGLPLGITDQRDNARTANATAGIVANFRAPTNVPPNVPGNLLANATSSVEILLTWADTSTNETGFRIERSSDGANFATVITLGANVNGYSDTGLAPATSYSYRVAALNNYGDSGFSNVASATTAGLPPNAPTNLTATAVAPTQINLSWSDNAGNETGYKVERSLNNSAWSQVALLGANAAAYNDTTVSAATLYYYRVRATNTAGDSASTSVVSATTPAPVPPPASPGNLTALALTSTQVNLTWTDNAATETGYRIERSTDGVTFTTIAMPGANAVSFTDTTVTAPAMLSYRVRAYNGGGDSAAANATVNLPVNGLAAPWLLANIGAVGVNGSAGMYNAAYTVRGSGLLSSKADSFLFAYQSLSGDGEIKARLSAPQNTGTNARLGVMIRESLTVNSRFAFMGVDGGAGFYWTQRNTNGGNSSAAKNGNGAPPQVWVRLVRTGNIIYGYKSADGSTWTLVNSMKFSVATNICIGLAVSSGASATLNTSVFDNVAVRQ